MAQAYALKLDIPGQLETSSEQRLAASDMPVLWENTILNKHLMNFGCKGTPYQNYYAGNYQL